MFKKLLITASLAIFAFTGCSSKEEVTIVNEKGKYGTLESNSQVAIKTIYDDMSHFDDILDKNKKVEHPHLLNFHWLHDYSGIEYAIVEYQGKYGVVTRDNIMVAKPIFDSISKLFNGFFVVEIDDKYGYMNNNFQVVQKPIFRNAREFLEDVTFVQSNANGKWGCITKDMELKIGDVYDEIYNLYNGFARTVKNGKWGYIDDNCKVIVEPKYEYAYDFSKGFAKVKKDGQISYIDKNGKELSKTIFSQGENF